ncbi:MAG: alpha-amylase family glycosyl hydrolase, partial [Methanosarcinaceae archaeon]|nr:alpha-amylase family glycosyl hydrolase [Methanosarcinaceae archaeon]
DNWAYPEDLPYYYWDGAEVPYEFGFWLQADPVNQFQCDDAIWPVEFQDPDFYKRRGQFRNWDNYNEALDGDFLTLKELDIRKPRVLDSLIRVYKYWMSLADIDGFRVDTVKHTEDTATALFCNAVREYAKRIGKDNFFIFGEIVGDDETMQRYIGRNARIPGTTERFPSLDACLDFPLYFILEEVIKGFSNPAILRERYERFRTVYTDHGESGRYFVTFVDNHDQMSRPYKRFMHDNPHPQQAALAMGYLLTSQGIPCIYYGTEQGFDGGGDSDKYVRECMFGGKWGAFDSIGAHFFNEQNPIYQDIRDIATIRSLEPALRYGRQYFRKISEDSSNFTHPDNGRCTLAYSRILDTDEILVALNLDSSERCDSITVDSNLTPVGSTMVDLLNGCVLNVRDSAGRACVHVPLESHQMAILKRS